jgi:hypothetical protein
VVERRIYIPRRIHNSIWNGRGLLKYYGTTKRFSDFRKNTYQLNQWVIKTQGGVKQQFCGFDVKDGLKNGQQEYNSTL